MWVLAGAAVFAVAAMTAAWALVRAKGDGGWTDVAWSFAIGIAGVACALWPAAGAVGERQALVALMVGAWSARLGGYMLRRTATADHPDPRYERFKAEWGGWGFKAWLFLMIQALTVLVLVVSVRAAAIRPDAPLGWREALGVLILIAAVAGETLADRQMAAFRRDRSNKGKVADVGLWAWSRHPNYFFEWLGWLAYPVIALAAGYPFGWLSLLAPVQMFWLLNYVSGVPMLERQMLESRPDAYRAYQARVSRFFPRPPRRASDDER